MKELSLHILDIVQNSLSAKATLVKIEISESESADKMRIRIEDNGTGMDPALLQRVTDPFATTRTTRKVGLGIPLFKLAAEQAGGTLKITSKLGVGTVVAVEMLRGHIDRSPIGDMAGTLSGLISTLKTPILLSANAQADFIYTHTTDRGEFTFDTREAREMLGGVPLDTFEVVQWITEYIREGLAEIGAEQYE